MASINGDWFHSRSSSNYEELLTVRILVIESQKPEYIGFGWSGGRHGNPKMYQLADVAGIQPSTMQTKIRAMIRYGFVKEGNVCPIMWTRMGSLWNDLYTVGNHDAARKIYQLTLTISLALYAFNNSADQYTINPSEGEMPLKFLFNILDSQNSISLNEFEVLVDGNTSRVGGNASYWKIDLVNSGLFQESYGTLFYTGKYLNFINEIKNFNPNPMLTGDDWRDIRDNPLIEISPFKKPIRTIFEEIAEEQKIEDQLADGILTEPLVDAVAEQEETQIPEVDILSSDSRFSQSVKRVRNTTWAIRIKKKYRQSCAVPKCDVTGFIFVDAAHIKPDNAPENSVPHRAHILNGLCLCKNCHIAFDRGFFSLTDGHRIIPSSALDKIPEQHLKTVILSSADVKIKNRTDNRWPLVDFIRYHRANCFKV